jgi:hypothetical protein
MGVDRSTWPPMVRLGLWGLPNRGSAWAFVWISIAITVGSTALGFVHPIAFLGSNMVFAALWYYLSIRWVDQHSSWS